MIKIVLIDVGDRHVITESLLKNKKIQVVGAIISVAEKKQQKYLADYYDKQHCSVVQFEDLQRLRPDFLLILNCPKLIRKEQMYGIRTLNLHGGILPTYRGSSANAWAIINGEDEVGFSIHEATDEIDAGDIYKVYRCKLREGELYGDARMRLEEMFCEDILSLLEQIKRNEIAPSSQKDSHYIYTTKLHPEDGIIDWQNDTDYIYGVYRSMAKPYGTGVFFEHKNQTYEVTKMSRLTGTMNYICVPGAVVAKKENAIIIKTRDNVLKVEELKLKDEFICPAEYFKIGTRL